MSTNPTLSNGIVGLRREDKNVWERRSAFAPCHVKQMLSHGIKKVVVQPSKIRAFTDQEYKDAGAEINEDLSECGTIAAVKEVPKELLIPERTYFFFSHTVKAQKYNMPMLDSLLEKKIRLFDYERIMAPDRTRIVNSGVMAGHAGMINTLNGMGIAFLNQGIATPFLHVGLARHYLNLDQACEAIRKVGDIIKHQGLPEEICPMTISITGSGAVSTGAQQILHNLPCKYISVEDMPRYWTHTHDTKLIYVMVARTKDIVEPKDPGHHFNELEYFKQPELYVGTFHERVIPYTRVLVNGIFWDINYPRLLPTTYALKLIEEKRFPLMVLGDISADPNGSVEFYSKCCDIQTPFYWWDPEKNQERNYDDYTGKGVLIMGVDHLPGELPLDSSTDFGEALTPMLIKAAASSIKDPLDQQEKDLGPELFGGMMVCDGEYTPLYSFLPELRKQKGV